MSVILILATVQAFFLVALTMTKKNKIFADKLLAVWLGLLGLHLLINLVYTKFQFQNYTALNLSAGFPYLQGPLLYLYVRTLALRQTRLNWVDVLHFIPCISFVVYLGVALNSFSSSANHPPISVHLFAQSIYFNVLLLASVPIYIMASILLLKRYQKIISNSFSSLDKINLNWLKYLLWGLAAVWVVVITEFFLYQMGSQSHTIFISITIFLYALGYIGLTQSTVFSNLFIYNETMAMIGKKELKNQKKTASKYQKSGLKQQQALIKKDELLAFMEQHKPYLDEQITLYKLASQMEMSTHHLSQLINEQCQQNFFDFINSYRIERVKQRLESSKFNQQSILSIAYDAGFASKSSFNRLFKIATGKTPSQFRKEK